MTTTRRELAQFIVDVANTVYDGREYEAGPDDWEGHVAEVDNDEMRDSLMEHVEAAQSLIKQGLEEEPIYAIYLRSSDLRAAREWVRKQLPDETEEGPNATPGSHLLTALYVAHNTLTQTDFDRF